MSEVPRKMDLLGQWETMLYWFQSEHRLTRSELAVLFKLLQHHNNRTGQCNPSVGRLSRDIGIERRTVQLALKRLRRVGAVSISYKPYEESNYFIYRKKPSRVSPTDKRVKKSSQRGEIAKAEQANCIAPNKKEKIKKRTCDRHSTTMSSEQKREIRKEPMKEPGPKKLYAIEQQFEAALNTRGLSLEHALCVEDFPLGENLHKVAKEQLHMSTLVEMVVSKIAMKNRRN